MRQALFAAVEPIVPKSLAWFSDGLMLLLSLPLLYESWVRFTQKRPSGIGHFPEGAVGLLVLLAFFFALWASLHALLTRPARVTLDPQWLRVRWGPFRRDIALAHIEQVEVRPINPLAEFGGWGWRYARGGWAVVTAHARRGVRLTVRNAPPFTLAIERADELAGQLRAALPQP